MADKTFTLVSEFRRATTATSRVLYEVNQAVSVDEETIVDITLDAGAADVAIPLGGITTVEFLTIRSTSAFTIKLNGSADAIQGNKYFALLNTSITSILVTNLDVVDENYVTFNMGG